MATFGEKIKGIRFYLGFTQQEIADKLDVSKQVISKYENEQTSPRLDTVNNFAKILGIDLTFLINDGFSVEETIIAVEDATKRLTVINSPIIDKTVKTMRRLNDNGQGKVADYADDLDKSGQYKRTPAKPEPSKVMELPESYFVDRDDVEDHHIDHAAAAGRPTEGIYNGFAEEDDIMVRKDEDRPDYDKVIEARGNSMEPLIMSGDVLFLRYQPTANTGDIVVVRYLECVYVKKFIRKDNRYVVLRSINPDVPDRTIDLKRLDDPNDFRIIALVVDWETPIKREQLI